MRHRKILSVPSPSPLSLFHPEQRIPQRGVFPRYWRSRGPRSLNKIVDAKRHEMTHVPQKRKGTTRNVIIVIIEKSHVGTLCPICKFRTSFFRRFAHNLAVWRSVETSFALRRVCLFTYNPHRMYIIYTNREIREGPAFTAFEIREPRRNAQFLHFLSLVVEPGQKKRECPAADPINMPRHS